MMEDVFVHNTKPCYLFLYFERLFLCFKFREVIYTLTFLIVLFRGYRVILITLLSFPVLCCWLYTLILYVLGNV